MLRDPVQHCLRVVFVQLFWRAALLPAAPYWLRLPWHSVCDSTIPAAHVRVVPRRNRIARLVQKPEMQRLTKVDGIVDRTRA